MLGEKADTKNTYYMNSIYRKYPEQANSET
jgi:hypothetical protein